MKQVGLDIPVQLRDDDSMIALWPDTIHAYYIDETTLRYRDLPQLVLSALSMKWTRERVNYKRRMSVEINKYTSVYPIWIKSQDLIDAGFSFPEAIHLIQTALHHDDVINDGTNIRSDFLLSIRDDYLVRRAICIAALR